MTFPLKVLLEDEAQAEREIERICESFDMDCIDLNHEACWRGEYCAGWEPFL